MRGYLEGIAILAAVLLIIVAIGLATGAWYE